MNREILWAKIDEYDYAVSSDGKIKRLVTKGTRGCRKEEHIISSRYNNNGYEMVDLYRNNKRKQFLVHRLVAMAFLENPQCLPYVNHKDENSKNNSVENLEWCTQKYNMNYGTCAERIGNSNSKAVIQKDKNGNIINIYNSIIGAARILGISNGNIGDCLHKKINSAGGFLWEYAQ